MLGGASRTCRTSPTCFHLSRGFLCRRGTENRENWHELTAFQREREREEFKWTWTQAKQRGDGDDRRFISSLSKKADPISPIDNTVCRTVLAEEAHQKDRKKQQKTGCGKCGPKKRYREYLYIIYIYYMIFIYIIYINFLEMSSRSSKSLNSRCEALESKSSEKMCWRSWTEEFGRRNDGFHDMFDDIFTSFSYDFL